MPIFFLDQVWSPNSLAASAEGKEEKEKEGGGEREKRGRDFAVLHYRCVFVSYLVIGLRSDAVDAHRDQREDQDPPKHHLGTECGRQLNDL